MSESTKSTSESVFAASSILLGVSLGIEVNGQKNESKEK